MAQQYWWKPAIVSMPAMTLSVSDRSGFVRIEWGSISFAPDAFPGEPPAKSEISLDWGLDASMSIHIFDGTIIRRSWTDRQVDYDLYEPEYATRILDEGHDHQNTITITGAATYAGGTKTQLTTSTPHGFSSGNDIFIQETTSYNGKIVVNSVIDATNFVIDEAFVADETGTCSENIVAKPLVIGTVTHIAPQRTGEAAEEKYYLPDFASYDCYDGGVIIPDHWTDNGDGTISRSISIVAGLTMSGTGNMTTLADVFTWAADRMGLTLQNIHGADVQLNTVIYDNGLLVETLDRLAYYCGYMFWILDGVMYLADRDQDNGVQTIGQFDFVELTYHWNMPVKKYTAEWSVKRFDSDAVELVDDNRSVEHYTDNSIGEAGVSLNVYDEAITTVRSRVAAIAARDALAIMKMSLPLDRLPNPGERMEFTDTRKNNLTITGYMRMTKCSLNYQSKTLDIEGPGEYTVS